MKNSILLFATFALQISFAQSIFPTNGENVGIGTTNPKSKLEITDWTTALTLGSKKNTEAMVDNEVLCSIDFYKHYNIGYAGAIKLLQAGEGHQYSQAHLGFYTTSGGNVYTTAPDERMRITSLGNVGIGTETPNARLDLGSGYGKSGAKFFIYNDDVTSELSGTKCGFYMDNFTSNNLNLVFPEASSYPGLFTISAKNTANTTLKPYFSIAGLSGNVGIGELNPKNKLDVNGTIHSKEVKVDMEGWSDFVFKKEYNLPTLEEVEKHIAEKGHLENIPSEKEVLQNGINLGEMNAKLLQKIEELTLYLLKQDKSIEDLKIEVNNLKKQYK